MSLMNEANKNNIVIIDVSRWYGEVLGVNRVNLVIPPGITSLVGPNGSGKTTLMNLMTGLIKPSRGEIRVLNIPLNKPEELFHHVGYCTQYEPGFPWMTGYMFLSAMLRIRGYTLPGAQEKALQALDRVGMLKNKDQRMGAYSKGMKQRINIALAIAHDPRVLVLDEPLHGLDPMVRFEMIDLFHRFMDENRICIISSHILHEVESLSGNVVILNHGYVVAEGNLRQVRSEIKEQHPLKIYVRCDQPALLSSKLFELDGLVSVNIMDDNQGIIVSTRNIDSFYKLVNDLVITNVVDIKTMSPADESVQALYDYLVGPEKGE